MRQNLFDAAFLLGVVSGSAVALGLAWLLFLFATCWTIDLWQRFWERVAGR